MTDKKLCANKSPVDIIKLTQYATLGGFLQWQEKHVLPLFRFLTQSGVMFFVLFCILFAEGCCILLCFQKQGSPGFLELTM